MVLGIAIQESFAKGYLSGPLPELPAWSGRGEEQCWSGSIHAVHLRSVWVHVA